MIDCKITLYFFYLHLFEDIIENISELCFEFSVYNFLTVFWTKYDVVGTEIIGSMCHGLKKDYNISDLLRVFLHSAGYCNLFSDQGMNGRTLGIPPTRGGGL